jgi:phage gp46-like protein
MRPVGFLSRARDTVHMISAQLNPLTGDYTTANAAINHLANSVYIRLVTPLKSWWADPSLGSRLHELQRDKDVPRVRVLSKQYAEQALEPLLADGRAKSVEVAVSDEIQVQPTPRAVLLIEVVDASDRRHPFTHYVQVGG